MKTQESDIERQGERMYTVAELAAAYHACERTIMRRAIATKARVVRIGRRVLIPESSIRTLLG